jgi:hypothetical protein
MVGFRLRTTAPKGKRKPKRRTPVFALGPIVGCVQSQAYRRAATGVYGWVYEGRRGENAFVDTSIVEMIIGQEISDAEIDAAITLTRARATITKRQQRGKE